MNTTGWLNNVHIMTMDTTHGGGLGVIEKGLIGWEAGKISYVGLATAAPEHSKGAPLIDGKGAWVTPGLIDCHTHLIWGGHRALEFEALLEGISYADIAKKGGGIKSTVAATRALTGTQLFDQALPRLTRLQQEGVTCVEIKSGYGLDEETECRMLRVMSRLQAVTGLKIVRTCLAAHSVPLEYAGQQQAYVDWICDTLLPKVADEQLADAVDVFCESIAFSVVQSEQIWVVAQSLGLQIKGHVGQLGFSTGSDSLSRLGGLSADHVEYLTESQVKVMAQAAVTAVLLPGAYYFLRETQQPPIDMFRQYQVPMAVATDLNPGSSPLGSLLLAANMACVLWRMTPVEVWQGITCHAARALGLGDQKGILRAGYDADFLLWSVDTPIQIIHEIGLHHPENIWVAGQQLR